MPLFVALWSGCGASAYRLDGEAEAGISEVCLLDSTAAAWDDSVRAAYVRASERLVHNRKAALDSVRAGVSSLNAPITRSESEYQVAVERYRDAFRGMERFRSFAGNPVFSEEDASVSTERLQEEVSHRVYRGRTFSLETEGEIARYIRRRLAPLEREVIRARSAMNRLKQSRSNRSEDREQVEEAYAGRQKALLDRRDEDLLTGLEDRVLFRTAVDSLGRYRFMGLPTGVYYLYVPHPLPEGWLVPVEIRQHTRQDLGPENRRMLLRMEDG